MDFVNSAWFGVLKRLIAFLIGIGCVALNKKFGLDIGTDGQAEITALVATFIGQSAWKAGKAIEAKVETAGSAAGAAAAAAPGKPLNQ